jgi:hypothetical protein
MPTPRPKMFTGRKRKSPCIAAVGHGCWLYETQPLEACNPSPRTVSDVLRHFRSLPEGESPWGCKSMDETQGTRRRPV